MSDKISGTTWIIVTLVVAIIGSPLVANYFAQEDKPEESGKTQTPDQQEIIIEDSDDFPDSIQIGSGEPQKLDSETLDALGIPERDDEYVFELNGDIYMYSDEWDEWYKFDEEDNTWWYVSYPPSLILDLFEGVDQ